MKVTDIAFTRILNALRKSASMEDAAEKLSISAQELTDHLKNYRRNTSLHEDKVLSFEDWQVASTKTIYFLGPLKAENTGNVSKRPLLMEGFAAPAGAHVVKSKEEVGGAVYDQKQESEANIPLQSLSMAKLHTIIKKSRSRPAAARSLGVSREALDRYLASLTFKGEQLDYSNFKALSDACLEQIIAIAAIPLRSLTITKLHAIIKKSENRADACRVLRVVGDVLDRHLASYTFNAERLNYDGFKALTDECLVEVIPTAAIPIESLSIAKLHRIIKESQHKTVAAVGFVGGIKKLDRYLASYTFRGVPLNYDGFKALTDECLVEVIPTAAIPLKSRSIVDLYDIIKKNSTRLGAYTILGVYDIAFDEYIASFTFRGVPLNYDSLKALSDENLKEVVQLASGPKKRSRCSSEGARKTRAVSPHEAGIDLSREVALFRPGEADTRDEDSSLPDGMTCAEFPVGVALEEADALLNWGDDFADLPPSPLVSLNEQRGTNSLPLAPIDLFGSEKAESRGEDSLLPGGLPYSEFAGSVALDEAAALIDWDDFFAKHLSFPPVTLNAQGGSSLGGSRPSAPGAYLSSQQVFFAKPAGNKEGAEELWLTPDDDFREEDKEAVETILTRHGRRA